MRYIISDILDYHLWLQDGGWVTAEQFRALPKKEKADILDYLSKASLYETIEYGGKRYILVHAGLANFSPDKDLADYDLYDFLEEWAYCNGLLLRRRRKIGGILY